MHACDSRTCLVWDCNWNLVSSTSKLNKGLQILATWKLLEFHKRYKRKESLLSVDVGWVKAVISTRMKMIEICKLKKFRVTAQECNSECVPPFSIQVTYAHDFQHLQMKHLATGYGWRTHYILNYFSRIISCICIVFVAICTLHQNAHPESSKWECIWIKTSLTTALKGHVQQDV